MQKTSLFGNSLIWFGAAVSIAEIITGMLLAPLGFGKAAAAIIIGHVIGSLLLYFAGLIGASHSVSAMEGVKRSFGAKGGLLFAVLNLIQLVGWTGVMISAGSRSACGILTLPVWLWASITGGLILVWILLKTSELKILNSAAILLLFLLSAILCTVIFRNEGAVPAETETGTLTFAEALELSIAMPLSWLPLIADYTCGSGKPKLISGISAGVYSVISCWMYFIGLSAALYAGGADITQIMEKAGLGIPALLIIVFSTVTTTYLDVFSSGMSMQSITKKIPPRLTGIAVCIIGVLLAIFGTTDTFEGFLYWIGSVFAPMIAIQIVDFFILKKADFEAQDFHWSSLVIWGIGFILYRILLEVNPACGSTLPVMVITGFLRFGYGKIYSCCRKNV